jgi:hypothetical protein
VVSAHDVADFDTEDATVAQELPSFCRCIVSELYGPAVDGWFVHVSVALESELRVAFKFDGADGATYGSAGTDHETLPTDKPWPKIDADAVL